MEMEIEQKMEVFLLPLPAAGHLASMVEMAAGLLAHCPDLSFTVLLMATPIPRLRFGGLNGHVRPLLTALGDAVRVVELPVLQLSEHIQECEEMGAVCSLYVEMHGPLVKAAISSARGGVAGGAAAAALVVDFFATTMIDVADELGIPTYLYVTMSASVAALMLYAPTLDEEGKLPVDVDGDGAKGVPVEVPGFPPIPTLSMPAFTSRSRRETYEWFVYHGRRFRDTKGMILNTFTELEPRVLKAIGDGLCVPGHPTPKVYTIGPVLGIGGHSKEGAETHPCINWLDRQPPESVVFLCFGSTGVFTGKQLSEIARGLERAGYRFLWSVGRPADAADVEGCLPEGFLERTAGRGLVWPAWVPQVDILAHPAVAGFVTHCGWNSCLESLWFGVPMLAWPMVSEQHFNAFAYAEEMGVALALAVDRRGGNFVGAAELERGLRGLMEEGSEGGRKARRRAQEMKELGRRAVQAGGSSYACLEALAMDLIDQASSYIREPAGAGAAAAACELCAL